MKTTRIGLASAIASALVLVGGMPCAAADSDRDTQVEGPGVPDLGSAKNFYAEGRKKYKERDFAAALLNFQRAEEFRATPQAERYIGGCLDALGRYREAIDWYDRFLAHVPAHWASQGTSTSASARPRSAPSRVVCRSSHSPAGASVEIDGKERLGSPPRRRSTWRLGRTDSPCRQEGRKTLRRSRLDEAFASTQSIVLQLDESPPVAVAAAETGESSAAAAPSPSDGTESTPAIRSGGHSRLPAYLSAGVAVLAAGAGTAFGVVALSDKKTFERDPTPENASRRNSDALVAVHIVRRRAGGGGHQACGALHLFMKKDSPSACAGRRRDGVDRASAFVRMRGAFSGSRRRRGWTPHGGGAGFVVQF